MTVGATRDVRAFDAHVPRARAAVAPPLGRAEETDDGRARRDGQVRRPRIAADVERRAPRQRVKTFQRKAHGCAAPVRLARAALSANSASPGP
jgi:hypothetical protein